MATITQTQQQAINFIVKAVMDTIRESGTVGAPAGVLYAALMTQGCSFNQFTSLMGALERAGKVRLEDDCYFIA